MQNKIKWTIVASTEEEIIGATTLTERFLNQQIVDVVSVDFSSFLESTSLEEVENEIYNRPGLEDLILVTLKTNKEIHFFKPIL